MRQLRRRPWWPAWLRCMLSRRRLRSPWWRSLGNVALSFTAWGLITARVATSTARAFAEEGCGGDADGVQGEHIGDISETESVVSGESDLISHRPTAVHQRYLAVRRSSEPPAAEEFPPLGVSYISLARFAYSPFCIAAADVAGAA
ncbi:hypothetical protein CYMTET_7957 [Cymbomonas tetramitiformis]|uniref:Uncharacterized protein n=1 Tax=Cymbomonas tetramitiformis TaxID=36881 RepID=A0AAE0GVW6_9CHLO|nr:hypothetical protein CYMTET_7957 [Cymbomonas tetramitiformis]